MSSLDENIKSARAPLEAAREFPYPFVADADGELNRLIVSIQEQAIQALIDLSLALDQIALDADQFAEAQSRQDALAGESAYIAEKQAEAYAEWQAEQGQAEAYAEWQAEQGQAEAYAEWQAEQGQAEAYAEWQAEQGQAEVATNLGTGGRGELP
jgi:hypothetical protein